MTVPTGWTDAFGTGGVRVVRTHYDLEPWLEIVANFNQHDGILLDAISSSSQQVLALLTIETKAQSGTWSTGPLVCGSESGGNHSHYHVEFSVTTGEARIVKRVSSSDTVLDTQSISEARVALGVPMWVRLTRDGSADTVSCAIWDYGTAEPSPQLSASSVGGALSGKPGCGVYYQQVTRLRHFGAVDATSGAPGPEDVTPPLDEITDKDTLDVIVTLSGATGSDDSEVSGAWSTSGCITSAEDDPAETVFVPLVQGVDLRRELDAEKIADVGSLQDSSITLDNTPTTPSGAGPLDTWYDTDARGASVQVAVGKRGTPVRTWHRMHSGRLVDNPSVSMTRVGIRSSGAVSRLKSLPIRRRRYTGNRTGWQSLGSNLGVVTVSDHSDYRVSQFTISAWFRTTNTGDFRLVQRRDGSDASWWVLVDNGVVKAGWAESSSITVVHSVGSGYNDGLWHEVVWAAFGGVESRIMVDGELLEELTSGVGTPDDPSSIDVKLARFNESGDELSEVRFYDAFLDEEEMRAIYERYDGTGGDGLVSVWRFDDAAGSTVTDYVSSHDGTVANTEGVDWDWAPTDLGDPELAGLPMPLWDGTPVRLPLQRIDAARERFRHHTHWSNGIASLSTQRAKGVTITSGTESNGVIAYGSASDEPLTLDVNDGIPNTLLRPVEVLDQMLTGYTSDGEFPAVDDAPSWNEGSRDAIQELMPYSSGIAITEERTAYDLLVGQLREINCAVWPDEHGLLVPDHISSPMAPGPIDNECLDFLAAGDGVQVGIGSTSATDFTVAGWFKVRSHRPNYGAYGGTQRLITIGIYQRLEIDHEGRLQWYTNGISPGTLTSQYKLGLNQWFFVAATLDYSTNDREIWVGTPSRAVFSVASDTGVSGPADGLDRAFVVGGGGNGVGFSGAAQHCSLWTDLLTESELNDLRTGATVLDGSETNLEVALPLTDGSGLVARELVAGGGADIGGCRWAPRLSVDLTGSHGDVELGELRKLAAWTDLEIRYARNWGQIGSHADIAGSATETERQNALRRHQAVTPRWAETRSSVGAKSLELDSCLRSRGDAAALARLLGRKIRRDKWVASLRRLGLDALRVRTSDEVLVRCRGGLVFSMRALGGGVRANRDAFSLELDLWGDQG